MRLHLKKLEVYKCAIEFLALATEIVEARMPNVSVTTPFFGPNGP